MLPFGKLGEHLGAEECVFEVVQKNHKYYQRDEAQQQISSPHRGLQQVGLADDD